jgi:hypothetical protein
MENPDKSPHRHPPESRAAAKRRRFFERAVEAHARATGRTDGKFICPICLGEFDRKALEGDLLSLEHVPPRSAGGRELCLTCRRCNSAAGHGFDHSIAEAARYRAMRSGLTGHRTAFSSKATIESDGGQLNAGFRFDENGIVIEVHEQRNDPTRYSAQMENLQRKAAAGGSEMHFRLNLTFRFGPRKLFVSWLKAVYLAAFAKFGYDYALRDVLKPVRMQILQPDETVVSNSALALDTHLTAKFDGPNILHVRAPLDSLMVYFPASKAANGTPLMVILPMPDSPDDFFTKLAASYISVDGQRRINTDASPLGWPRGPEFLADFSEE